MSDRNVSLPSPSLACRGSILVLILEHPSRKVGVTDRDVGLRYVFVRNRYGTTLPFGLSEYVRMTLIRSENESDRG